MCVSTVYSVLSGVLQKAHTGLRSNELMILHQPIQDFHSFGQQVFFYNISAGVEPTPTDCQIISIHHNIQDKLKLSPVQTSILTQSSVLICLSLLKRHERLTEGDTGALLLLCWLF